MTALARKEAELKHRFVRAYGSKRLEFGSLRVVLKGVPTGVHNLSIVEFDSSDAHAIFIGRS